MPSNDQDYHCYAVRRLNPFRGVIQILQSHECRAISVNGSHWEIQIKAIKPDDLWGSESPGEPIYRYIRFGTWTEATGLKQVPAHPFLDLTKMFEKSEEIIQQLQTAIQQLPFPLEDNYEQWLLDGEQRMPLALLQSVVSADEMPLHIGHSWIAADTSSKDFPSPTADQEHPPHPKDTNPHPHLSALTNIMRNKAGHALTQWFKRAADGSGAALPLDKFPELNGRILPTEQFPELLIGSHNGNTYEQALISDYLHWQSPLLLTLQQLSKTTRAELEIHAAQQALYVSELWRIYPETINPDFINTARVEARLRTASS